MATNLPEPSEAFDMDEGMTLVEALVNPVRDSRFGDVDEIQRALSYLESELD
ncbi:MAG: hypothetical protein R6V35_05750 [Candidatus Nanohaloarchaea archaeon]